MAGGPQPLKEQLERARRDAYRRCVLSAARELFEQRGYRGVTMTDIAAGVGVSKGTLYNYFESKEALLAEMLTATTAELYNTIDQQPPAAGWAKLEAIAAEMLRFGVRNAPLLSVFREAKVNSVDGIAGCRKAETESEIVRRLRACLEAVTAEEALRTDLSTDFMARALLRTIIASADALPAGVKDEALPGYAAQLISLFRHGATGPFA